MVLAALLGPVLIAFLFLMVFSTANQPISAEEYRADPHMGQKIADRNNSFVLGHAILQFVFVVLGAWWFARHALARVLFLVVAIPVSAIVFLLSLVSLIAK